MPEVLKRVIDVDAVQLISQYVKTRIRMLEHQGYPTQIGTAMIYDEIYALSICLGIQAFHMIRPEDGSDESNKWSREIRIQGTVEVIEEAINHSA